jgi:hypothetical protein
MAWQTTRALLANKSAKLPSKHPELIALRAKLRGEMLWKHVTEELALYPRPMNAQLTAIAHMLLDARSTEVDSDEVEVDGDELAACGSSG